MNVATTQPPLPTRKGDIIVHLVFSDGCSDINDAWELYTIALFPFTFGIKTEQVFLTATKQVEIEEVDGWRQTIERRRSTSSRPKNDAEYLPSEYHAYIKEIYRNRTTGFDVMSSTVPGCTIRVVSGRGFCMTRRFVMRTSTSDGGKQNIPFTDLPGNPSALSIFDICGSQYGAAVVFGHFSSTPNRKFTDRESKVAASKAPFVIENADDTYAFRVGAAGLHLNPPANETDLSIAFGDAVICCVLAAAKTFVDNSMTGDLDTLFQAKYNKLITSCLNVPGFPHKLKPVTNLGHLQTLMQQGLLQLNPAAFNCSLFARQDEWFLCRARTKSIISTNGTHLAKQLNELLIDFVVTSLQLWHHTHPNEAEHFELCAEKIWQKLSGLLGPQLTRIRLDWDDDAKILLRSNDGMPIGVWAMACRDLAGITKHVQNMILSGSWDDNEKRSYWTENTTVMPMNGDGGND